MLCPNWMLAHGEDPGPVNLPSISEKTEGMDHLEGYFNLHWDRRNGRLFWEMDKLDTEFLYQVSLASGLGSNPVGLDRGRLAGTYVFVAQRIGPRILLLQRNYRYRALSNSPEEIRAVRESFAPSVHWGFEVAAENVDGAVLVDATEFFLQDRAGTAQQMEKAGQGKFELDPNRSAFFLPRTKAFPRNTEIETMLTFTSPKPGPLVQSVAASGEAVTLRQHHSLVKLPDPGYTPRRLDPRIGINGPTIQDYATAIDEDLRVHWVARHRLRKKDPSLPRSEAVAPLVYYIDRGIPEPIQSAVIESSRWWNDAFEAAGYIDAFRVELLPAEADPLDIRYNVVYWNHRSTRGWSYGDTVVDPRTGEIIKGNVNLGSLRLKQDHLLGTGLIPPYSGGTSQYSPCGLSAAPGFEYLAQVTPEADAVKMALARVRQLTAHEIGHTLGFPHNYLASSYGRASVMDYPAPLIGIGADEKLDFSDAYAAEIGAYDKLAVEWLYQDFPEGTDEAEVLNSLVEEGLSRGIEFMGHIDNHFVGAAHPTASVWDNGSDLVAGLKHEIEVRRLALQSFGPEAIRKGDPLSALETVLVPLYLHHRFQLNSAAQSLGGADYHYALRGDGRTHQRIVPGTKQREALETILSTLTVDFLALPERILQMIAPPAFRRGEGERFERYTGLTFDSLAAAESAAHFSLAAILHPRRMARLVEFGSRSREYPDLGDVVDRLIEATWKAPPPDELYPAQIQEVIQQAVIEELLTQAGDVHNRSQVRAILTDRLLQLANSLESLSQLTPHQAQTVADIRRWENRPEGDGRGVQPLGLPPGSPIGTRSR